MKTIITGGAGFIGSNASSRYLRGRGHQVGMVDNLSRATASARTWNGCVRSVARLNSIRSTSGTLTT